MSWASSFHRGCPGIGDGRRRSVLRVWRWTVLLLLLTPAIAYPGQATLSWNANSEPDVAGYKVYFGQASRSYQPAIDVGDNIGYTVTGLQEGRLYFFAVTAYDSSGNESVFSSEVSMTVLDTAPPAISAVAVPVRTTTGANISWTTSEASDSQVQYGTTTAYGSVTTLNVSLVTAHLVALTGLTESRLYHFRVLSRDAAGNLATSGDFTFTTLDATPPSVALTAPATGATVSGTVTVSANASDNLGVVGVQFRVDGINVGVEDTVAPYAIAWNTSSATPGAHTLTAVARDAAGNVAVSTGVVVTIAADTTVPVLSAIAASSITVSGARISWTSNEPGDTQVEYGPTTAYGSLSTLNASLVTSHVVNLSGLVDNRLYHFRVRSRDAAGNLATSADFTFTTLDGTPPSVGITAPAAGSVAGILTLVASATDNLGVAGVQFQLDGAALGVEVVAAPYTLTWDTTSVPDGSHALSAVARDTAGNSTISAVVTVTVSNGSVQVSLSPQDTSLNIDATNYSANALLTVYTWPDNAVANAILMKFDLSSLPAGVVVQDATLLLALVQSDTWTEPTYTVTAHKVLGKNPVITGATGMTSDGVTSWTPNTCCQNNVPLAQADISASYDTRAIDRTPGYKSWTLTTMVREWWAAPTANFGVLLNSDASKLRDRHRYFASMEHPDATIRPFLRVTYFLPSGLDVTPPSVAITAPAAGATVSGSATITAGATDDVGVVGVQFKVDGVNRGVEDTAAPFSISWDTRTASNGAHTLTAVARDAAGNVATSTAITVTVANPTLTVTPAAPTDFGSVAVGATADRSFTVSNSGAGTLSGTATAAA
ncbi:MAG: Ig-like domain-containing protein, partial [Nocardioidaceae bacterium]